MNDDILPEEKLLRLIRGNKNNDVSLNKVATEPITDSKPAVKYAGKHLVRKFAGFFNINTILQAVFIAACLYLAISFIYPGAGLQGFKPSEETSVKVSGFNKDQAYDIKPYEFYSESIKKRPIFTSPVKQENYKQPAVKAVTQDLLKDLILLGIVSGENPQAIIEDKNTQKTYYLNKGEFIGEFQVMDIREGKIILDFNGQVVELNL